MALALEAALDAGKTVLVCKPGSTTLHRRRLGFTLIENYPLNKEKPNANI